MAGITHTPWDGVCEYRSTGIKSAAVKPMAIRTVWHGTVGASIRYNADDASARGNKVM